MKIPKLLNSYFVVETKEENGVCYHICKTKDLTKSLIDIDTKENILGKEIISVEPINEYRLLFNALTISDAMNLFMEDDNTKKEEKEKTRLLRKKELN